MTQRNISYEILNPKSNISSKEDILNGSNFESFGKYPAAEFDDIGEFFIFLKEAGIEKKDNHIIISIKEVDSSRVESIYFLVTAKNAHMFGGKGDQIGYRLIKQEKVN